jgi:prepilin-type processing-associated H-X9-DG protein
VPARFSYYATITGYATWLYPQQASTPNPSAWRFPKISEIAKIPTQRVYMWEGFHDFVDGHDQQQQLSPGTYKWDNQRRVALRHNDGMNCLFYDWHVKWMKRTMVTPNWPGWR